MTILDIISTYWKEGLFYLIIGSGLIQISPIKLNPFSWAARFIGNSLNHDVNESLKRMDKKMDSLENRLEEHIRENSEQYIKQCRERIIRFSEDLQWGEKAHSQEHYDDILSDIDEYEEYCSKHEDFLNNKAKLAIKYIKDDYAERLKTGTFLQ